MTEQRSAERALRESEARFRRIANSAPAMMWVTRLDRARDFVSLTKSFERNGFDEPWKAVTIGYHARVTNLRRHCQVSHVF